jgi:hypothetical protein
MLRNAFVVSCAVTICITLGCGPAEVKPPPTGPVKGTVTLNGEPMAAGELIFSIPGEPVQQIPVTNGAFSGQAPVGKNKVEVYSYQESAPTSGLSTDTVKKTNIVSDQFNVRSALSENVTAAGPNEFKFAVTSK